MLLEPLIFFSVTHSFTIISENCHKRDHGQHSHKTVWLQRCDRLAHSTFKTVSNVLLPLVLLCHSWVSALQSWEGSHHMEVLAFKATLPVSSCSIAKPHLPRWLAQFPNSCVQCHPEIFKKFLNLGARLEFKSHEFSPIPSLPSRLLEYIVCDLL